MRKIGKKKLLVAGAAVAIVATGGGVALAYWTSQGNGSGSATTGSDTAFQVDVAAPTGGSLSPNGPTDHVGFTVTNKGSGDQSVSNATAEVKNGDGTTWNAVAGCSAADYSITNVSISQANLKPGASTTGSFDIQMIDSGADQNGCKNASVPLYVHVS